MEFERTFDKWQKSISDAFGNCIASPQNRMPYKELYTAMNNPVSEMYRLYEEPLREEREILPWKHQKPLKKHKSHIRALDFHLSV